MAILIYITDRNVSQLKQHLQQALPSEKIYLHSESYSPKEIEAIIAWKHPSGSLRKFPNLGLISSLGAGVDHLLKDKKLPKGIPICRIVSKGLELSMQRYIQTAVLHFHKNIYAVYQQKITKTWDSQMPTDIPLRIGIMGLGALGKSVAISLHKLGFNVLGFSRKAKQIEGIACFSDEDNELSTFLAKINTLICMLPLTKATAGILDSFIFDQLPRGSFLINVGRGAHIVEGDLLHAMEVGQIKEAWLDVFQQEPLPPRHPFWDHEAILVTPHIASITNQKEAAEIFAENFSRFKASKHLLFEVNIEQGY